MAKNKADVVKKQRAYLKQKKKNMPQKVKLTKEDCLQHENLLLKERLVQSQAQTAMKEIRQAYEQLMAVLSEREGVNIKEYKIDWTKGEGVYNPPKPEKPSRAPASAPAQDEKPQE